MKKLILTVCFLLMAQCRSPIKVFADEIINSKGEITPCKIVTVSDGLVEYQIDGCLYNFKRIITEPVFTDYVDVKTDLHKKNAIKRYTGTVVVKDFDGTTIRTNGEDMTIPWYRVKFIGIYNPN